MDKKILKKNSNKRPDDRNTANFHRKIYPLYPSIHTQYIQHAPVVKARLLRPQSALAGWAQGGRSNLAGTAVNRRRHHRCQPGNTNGASDTHTADGNTNTNTTTYSPPKATWLQAPNTLETNVSQAILRPTRTNCGLANPAREALMLAGLVLVETILA
ncbi:predicted protein [Histoplasma capsulatum H143]|uniref:Uncharacterized protein n=1 Tax=Ajellomyces capsulatus (strain H143) TaxID=544712 RepID=C6HRW7_AJECH|nr:predicted protein [Histoplasma capsulatum H143]